MYKSTPVINHTTGKVTQVAGYYHIMYSHPLKKDTDGDGLLDNEEMMVVYWDSFARLYSSYPWSIDSDGDGIYDAYDNRPLVIDLSYDRTMAIEYARKWSGDKDTVGERYNRKNYPNLEEMGLGDCANFVSQCIHSGGYQMSNKWYMGRAKDLVSSIIGLIKPTGTWDYGWSATWTVAREHYEFFSSQDYAMYSIVMKRDESIKEIIENYDIRKGDLLYFCSGGETVTHATIISDISEDDIFYCGHTDARCDYKLSSSLQNNENYAQVIIVCLHGRVN